MKIRCLISILIIYGCSLREPTSKTAVFGSVDIPGDPAPAHTVYIRYDGYICTGSAITLSDILTAAHCIEEGKVYEIEYMSSNGQRVRHESEVTHAEKFLPEAGSHFFDIGHIKLANPLPNVIQPVTLLADHALIGTAEIHTVSGYGGSETGVGTLQSIPVGFEEYLHRPYNQHLLLYSKEPGKGPCGGDSGGPSFAKIDGKWVQVGVFSGYSKHFNLADSCISGSSTYNFVGAYIKWLRDKTGNQLKIHGTYNPSYMPAEKTALALLPKTNEDKCKHYNYLDDVWWEYRDLRNLLILSVDSDLRYKLVRHCRLESNLMNRFNSIVLTAEESEKPDFTTIAKIPDLKSLTLQLYQYIDFDKLGSLANLEELNLRLFGYNNEDPDTPTQEIAFEAISSIKNLTVLKISHHHGLIDANDLLKLSKLKTLYLHNCKIINIELLNNHPTLQKVYLNKSIQNIEPEILELLNFPDSRKLTISVEYLDEEPPITKLK